MLRDMIFNFDDSIIHKATLEEENQKYPTLVLVGKLQRVPAPGLTHLGLQSRLGEKTMLK